MELEHLTKEEQKTVEQFNISLEYDPFIRFWDKDTIQIDGDCNLNDLISLVNIMKLLSKRV